MRLADAPGKRMLNGRISQKHSLFWWLPGYPDSIQVDQPARFAHFFLSDLLAPLIAPNQFARYRVKRYRVKRYGVKRYGVNPIESGAHLVLNGESEAGPTVLARVGLIGNLRQGLATVVGLKRLGLAR